MLNYTKGNWQVHPDLKKIVSVSRGDGTFSTIAECRLIGNYQTAEIEAKANARLIAAAPDMYEALTKLRAFMKDDSKFRMQIHTIAEEFEGYKIFEDCDKALAKAEDK